MSTYAEALLEFYSGEVLGETAYSALAAAARNDGERRKWETLLQLETETKAWLRAPMVAHGVSIEELAADRQRGVAAADQIKQLSWKEQMQGLHDAIGGRFVPLYQGHADAAKARGEAGEEAVCLYMVEHEKAQVEFARRELTGESAPRSLEPVVKFLKYPLGV
jgi:rubrerythrin